MLEWKIGLRYTRSKRRSHIASFISLVSTLGITVGVAALMTVMAVMNGFESELRSRILETVSHITIEAVYSRMDNWQPVRDKLNDWPGVAGVSPYIKGEMMVLAGDYSGGVMLRGIDPLTERTVSSIDRQLLEGSLDELIPGEFNLLLGRPLAEKLGVGVGDRVTLVTSQIRVTVAGAVPRMKRFRVVGVFDLGMHNYDMRLVFTHIEDAARLMKYGGDISGLRVRLDDADQASPVARKMVASLGRGYWGLDWGRRHRNLFSAIELQKGVMFIILSLIIAVAAFNLVATLIMVVNDKRGDIAILRTMGLGRGGIIRIFMIQGALIGLAGIVGGLILGTLLSLNIEDIVIWLEGVLGIDLVARDVYLITTLPGLIDPVDVIMTIMVTFVLGVLATIYPAWRAANISPAEALSYE